ncbi:MAG: dipeptidase, partial [Candidatus Atribacteria bacterium]|nr:dipeptidase [Candidatus Atribacteria bacterium]
MIRFEKQLLLSIFCTFFLFLFFKSTALSCTTFIVTPGATIDGSMIVAHSDDNHLIDQRIIYVPAM